ncbi:DUF6093 family protein [Streptomyces sp. NPDC018055]|uniref:DUF6093 family protein n=1 Tax=Streptomyces sp. NPDC018055 TaxID=3365038 RepID=UPI0037A75CC4
MIGLDDALKGAVSFIAKNLLIDTVRITLRGVDEPILNTTTGGLEYPEGDTLYEGPGAVFAPTGTMQRSATQDAVQPWVQQQGLGYFLLTPLSAPVPPENALVSVVQVHDPKRTALLGRTWQCSAPGSASTVEVVRRTNLDPNTIPPGVDGGGP